MHIATSRVENSAQVLSCMPDLLFRISPKNVYSVSMRGRVFLREKKMQGGNCLDLWPVL
jgi:hypothetical protein